MTHKIAFGIITLGLFWAGLRAFERFNLYFPSREHFAHPGTYGIPYEDVELRTEDGVPLHGWYIDASLPDREDFTFDDPPLAPVEPLPVGKNGAPTVLFFHGNAGNISHRLQWIRIFRGMGASILIFDYRGYGKSAGRPSEEGTYLDGLAAVDYLEKTKGRSRESIFFFGHSLGSAVALETALRRPPAALVLDATFTSTVDMGRRILPFLPVDWLVRYRYDNLEKIGRLSTPVLLMHSEEDDIIPFQMGRRLFEAAREPKAFIRTLGDHNGGFMETPYFGKGIRDFVADKLR